MSKNPHKKPNPKIQSVIDEQNEPCCRAIWKKIRNANKKLLQIQDLEKKEDLKPQQIEKVNRKKGLLEQKSRYEQFLTFYKNTLNENVQAYRQIQFKQLRNLANAFTLAAYGSSNEACQKAELTHLWEILVSPSKKQTVSERVQSLNEAFSKIVSDRKLRDWIAQNIQNNGDKPFFEVRNEAKQQTPAKIQDSPKPKEKRAQKVDTPKPEKVQEKVEQPKVTEAVQPVAQKTEQAQQIVATEQVEKKEEATKLQANEGQKQAERKDGRGVRGRGPRAPRGQRGDRNRNYEDKDNNEKKKYKPKFVKKGEEGRDNQSSSEELEQQLPEVRDFKREEVKDLIEDGFVIVGKPKPKSHEQKKWHEHTHGNKFHHHHHQKQNY